VAEKLFNQAPVDTFLLEYDSERAGDFAPLRFLPKHKTVVLGLGLSSQCGFASVAGGNALAEEEQWEKLQLLVDTAQRVGGHSRADGATGMPASMWRARKTGLGGAAAAL